MQMMLSHNCRLPGGPSSHRLHIRTLLSSKSTGQGWGPISITGVRLRPNNGRRAIFYVVIASAYLSVQSVIVGFNLWHCTVFTSGSLGNGFSGGSWKFPSEMLLGKSWISTWERFVELTWRRYSQNKTIDKLILSGNFLINRHGICMLCLVCEIITFAYNV